MAPQDYELWAGYAEMERSHGRISSARNVISTALQASPTDRLFCDLAWLELEEGNPLRVLASLPDRKLAEAETPTLVLKAKQVCSVRRVLLTAVLLDRANRRRNHIRAEDVVRIRDRQTRPGDGDRRSAPSAIWDRHGRA